MTLNKYQFQKNNNLKDSGKKSANEQQKEKKNTILRYSKKWNKLCKAVTNTAESAQLAGERNNVPHYQSLTFRFHSLSTIGENDKKIF